MNAKSDSRALIWFQCSKNNNDSPAAVNGLGQQPNCNNGSGNGFNQNRSLFNQNTIDVDNSSSAAGVLGFFGGNIGIGSACVNGDEIGDGDQDAALRAELTKIYNFTTWLLSSLCAAAFLVNGYVLMSSFWLRKPISANLWLCLSLAAADLWCSFIFVAEIVNNSYIAMVVPQLSHPCTVTIIFLLSNAALATSVLHLFALAVNHFFGIIFPLAHRRYMTTRLVRLVMLVVWTVPLLLFIASGFFFPGEFFRGTTPVPHSPTRNSSLSGNDSVVVVVHRFCQPNPVRLKTFSYRICLAGPLFGFLVLTLLIYVRISFQLGKITRRASSLVPVSCTRTQPRSSSRNLFITMLMLMGSFILCFGPIITAYILICEDCLIDINSYQLCHLRVFIYQNIIINFLRVVKIFLNPLIYAIRVVELQYALIRMNSRTKRFVFICMGSRRKPNMIGENLYSHVTTSMAPPGLARTADEASGLLTGNRHQNHNSTNDNNYNHGSSTKRKKTTQYWNRNGSSRRDDNGRRGRHSFGSIRSSLTPPYDNNNHHQFQQQQEQQQRRSSQINYVDIDRSSSSARQKLLQSPTPPPQPDEEESSSTEKNPNESTL